jgi:hypothetical protein
MDKIHVPAGDIKTKHWTISGLAHLLKLMEQMFCSYNHHLIIAFLEK